MNRRFRRCCAAVLLGTIGPAFAAEVVIVSARKRDEALSEVPLSISTLGAQALSDYNIRNFADYAGRIPNLSYAYGNGTSPGETGTAVANARTIAIRGVAGARTTAYYLDDTPLPGAIDARVIDLAAIEVLKGPQGTLYGESSMGGNVRLVSRAPDLTRSNASASAELGKGARSGGTWNRGVSAIANVVLSDRAAALRVVAFSEAMAGYLEREYLSDPANPLSAPVRVDGQGASRTRGASLTGLFRYGDWDLTARLVHQDSHIHGQPAAYAPLPAFRVERVVRHSHDIQPEASDRWTMPVLALRYSGAGWSMHSSTSFFRRTAFDREDSTEGTAQFIASYGLGIPPVQPFAWTAERGSRQWTHETRFAFDVADNIGAIAGLYYSRLSTARYTPPVYGNGVLGVGGRSMLWEYFSRYRQDDLSLFGEAYVNMGKWRLTLGERAYRLRHADVSGWDGVLYGALRSAVADKASGYSPRLALAYHPSSRSMWYASAARGFRAGGSQMDLSPLLGGCVTATEAHDLASVEPDSLWSVEAGGKFDFPDPGLLLTGAVYRIDWKNIQQPAFVPNCAFYLLGNAGAARLQGAEIELQGRAAPGLELRFGAGYTDAVVSEQGSSRQLAGTRLRQVPRWNVSAGLVLVRELRPGLSGFMSADYSRTGDSLSANSTAREMIRPAYGLLNARLGLRWSTSELSLDMKNLANAQPNLGDLGYLGYLRFDADGTPMPMVATLPPRTFTVQYRQRF